MRLKELREKLSLSQPDCEKIFNIPLRTWQNWEEGKRKTPTYVYDYLINKMNEYLSILDIAKDCEKILSIKCPKIKFVPKKDELGVLAKVVVSNKMIKKINFSLDYENVYDAYFAICHELRHVYQIKYNDQIFEKYVEKDTGISTEHYNLQEAEIDANAFGSLYMQVNFGVKPLFLGYSDKVKGKIDKQIEKIMRDTAK
ncbi:helix-turn-helix domain-containing protein [Fannyhessea vaginae]|uniref:helix-turn-helix domain-containing protein n=1 Tax=Fannyhessea vaginae TaxID=82135 RepID=UPI003A7FDBA9